MAYDRKELAKALKVLDATPKEINRQRERYQDAMREIKEIEKTGNWSPNNIAGRRASAKAERDKTCAALTQRMRDAINIVAANNDYANTETIDFSSAKLKDALRTIEYMGADLSVADQAAMLSQFRGDVGSLRVLEKAFKKNNLYMKDAAHELMKPISNHAIEEMNVAIAFAERCVVTGDWSEDPFKRCMWTMGEFGKQLDRLALEDDAASVTPYSAVVDAMADKLKEDKRTLELDADMTDEDKRSAKSRTEAELLKLQLVQRELSEAQANGKDPAEVLNRQLNGMESRGTMPTFTPEFDMAAARRAAGLPT